MAGPNKSSAALSTRPTPKRRAASPLANTASAQAPLTAANTTPMRAIGSPCSREKKMLNNGAASAWPSIQTATKLTSRSIWRISCGDAPLTGPGAGAGPLAGESQQERRRRHAGDAAGGAGARRLSVHVEWRGDHRAEEQRDGEDGGGDRHREFRSSAIRQYSRGEQHDQAARCQRRRGMAHHFSGEVQSIEVEVVEKGVEDEASAEQKVAGNDRCDRAPFPESLTLSLQH